MESMTRRRYNCPLQNEHKRDRYYLFLEYVYSADPPRARYPASFAVTREIFFAFFGMQPLYDIFASESNMNTSSNPRQQEDNMGEQPSNQFGEPMNQEEEATSEQTSLVEPIDLEPHPPETPDRDREDIYSRSGVTPSGNMGIDPQPPKISNQAQGSFNRIQPSTPVQTMEGVEEEVPRAAGFEDHLCKAPLEKKAVISLHRKVAEILQMWYESRNTSLVVFLFRSRSYYKFRLDSEFALRSTILHLQREHYFLMINDHGTVAPDLEQIKEVALQERLILVGKHDRPNKGIEDENGQISIDDLREYVTKFDVRTGKRKAGGSLSRNVKRRAQQ